MNMKQLTFYTLMLLAIFFLTVSVINPDLLNVQDRVSINIAGMGFFSDRGTILNEVYLIHVEDEDFTVMARGPDKIDQFSDCSNRYNNGAYLFLKGEIMPGSGDDDHNNPYNWHLKTTGIEFVTDAVDCITDKKPSEIAEGDIGSFYCPVLGTVDKFYTNCFCALPENQEICNSIDDDCNGQVDDIGQQGCGLGVCTGQLSCIEGSLLCSTAGDDCGICCKCSEDANPFEIYDGSQNEDCTDTLCPDDGCGAGGCSTNIFGDLPATVANECESVFTCTEKPCSAECEIDFDEDLYSVSCNDCNDMNLHINPGVVEDCENELDDNCDGEINEGCGGSPIFAKEPFTGTDG